MTVVPIVHIRVQVSLRHNILIKEYTKIYYNLNLHYQQATMEQHNQPNATVDEQMNKVTPPPEDNMEGYRKSVTPASSDPSKFAMQ